MKKYAIFLIITFFIFGLSAKTSEVDLSLFESVKSGLGSYDPQDADKILNKTKKEIKKIEKQAQESVNTLKSDVESKFESVKADLDSDIKTIHDEAQDEIDQIKTEAQGDLSKIKQDMLNNVVNISKNTTSKIIELVRGAEEIAFKIRRKRREEAILQKLQQSFDETQEKLCEINGLNGELLKIPVPSYWKERMAQDFYKNSSILEQIVFDAESTEETKEFSDCFRAQKTWFDKTLSSTKYTSDPGYSQIIARKTNIENIVSAVKLADQQLNFIENKLKISDEEKRRIRLIILYEINTALQRLKYLPYKEQVLPDDDVKNLTLKVTQDVTGRASGIFPTVNFESIVLPNISNDAAVWVQLREDIDNLKNTLKSEILEKHELTEALKKLNIDLSDLGKKLDNERDIKGNLIQKLELCERNFIDQQIINKKNIDHLSMKDAEIGNLMSEISKTKKLLGELQNQNLEQKNRINIVEEISAKKISDYKKQTGFDSIKNQELNNRQQLELELQQRMK